MKKNTAVMYADIPQETRAKAVAHIVKMITGGEWEEPLATYEGICGWGGVMAPRNRPAFVQKFGPFATAALERDAREVLKGRADFWANSKAAGYEAIADNADANDPASFEVGTFVWGVGSGFKFDHENVREEIRNLVEREADNDALVPRLFKITRIEEVEDIEATAKTVLRGWKPQEGDETGSGSDDVSEEEVGKWGEGWSRLTPEQKRTFYTLAVLVRDGKGRWLLVDSQGYVYPRYIAFPKNWRDMYAASVREITAEIEAEKRAAEEAKAKEAAEARAEYDARCAKWTRIMQRIPERLRGHDYLPEYRKAAKRNVLAMAKTAFPWVRFSLVRHNSWGGGLILSWRNGPTVEEVEAATDFELFNSRWDEFDSMTDCASVEFARFTNFAETYGEVKNGVECRREECETDRNGSPEPVARPTPAPTGATGATITRNEERNGIEIRFPSRPDDDVLAELKANGWRWSRFSACWYTRYSDEAQQFADRIAAAV